MATKYIDINLPSGYLKSVREISDRRPILKNSHRGKMANYVGCLGCLGMYVFRDWVNKKLAKEMKEMKDIERLRAEVVDVVHFD